MGLSYVNSQVMLKNFFKRQIYLPFDNYIKLSLLQKEIPEPWNTGDVRPLKKALV